MADRPDDADPREKRLNEVLGAYLEAADAGWAPDPKALVSSYPDLAPRLEAFFAAQSRVDDFVYPAPIPTRKPSADPEATEDEVGHPAAATSHVPRVGDEVGDYVLVDLIREAGQGRVFKARQKAANLVVALKMVKKGRLATEKAVRAFLREAEALANLSHTQIVPIYFVGLHDDLPYFSMKLFERGSLQDHLPRFESDHRAAARLMVTIARAVQYANEHGLLHRDLKPGNILLDSMDQAYVADFGLAKLLPAPADTPAPGEPKQIPMSPPDLPAEAARTQPEPGDKTHTDGRSSKTEDRTVTVAPTDTQAGAFIGSKGYAPPENAFVTKDSATVRADVFGLGAILYRMLTGIPLFDAEKLDLVEYAYKVRNFPAPPPRQRNPKVDERLEAVCLKSLKTEPSERYATPAEMADDLERWLAGKPPLAWPKPWRMRAWDTVRPYLLVATLAMASGFALAAVFFVVYWFDPERVPRGLEVRARAGRLVLIGEKGPPVWSRWNDGDGTFFVSPEVDQPFSITTADYGRLELLRKAPAPRYRLSAEVKTDLPIKNNVEAGIYFAQKIVATDTGTVRYWCELSFTDVGPVAQKNGKVQLVRERFQLGPGISLRSTGPTEAHRDFPSAQAASRPAQFRKLEVRVTPEKVEAFFEQVALKALMTADLNKELTSFSGGKVVTRDFQFSPDGALGLFVFGGKASFQNVIVEPLD